MKDYSLNDDERKNFVLNYDKTDESINKWFGKESDGRKDALRGKEFHIDNNLGL